MEVLTLAAKLLLARLGGAVGRWEWLGCGWWAPRVLPAARPAANTLLR